MALNLLGGEAKQPATVPVTLPRVYLPESDDQTIAEEAAALIAERRVIRAGVDAWRLTQKSASFENWKLIGAALQVGRGVAVRASGTTTGKHYSRSFYDWANRYGFAGMNKEARWAAVDLVENLTAVEHWLATLPERQRKSLIHPLSVMRRWRRSLTPRPEPDCVALAQAALIASLPVCRRYHRIRPRRYGRPYRSKRLLQLSNQ